MSIQNIGTTGVVLPPSAESPLQKFKRKFQQEPLVPIGAGLTTIALIMASRQLAKGDSKKLNYWFRARIIFQGLTIAAVVGGTYAYGKSKSQKDEQARKEAMETEYEQVKEKRAFEERLKAAEEAHAAEMAFAAAGEKESKAAGSWGWFGFGKTHTVTSQDATGVPSSSHPTAPVPHAPSFAAAEHQSTQDATPAKAAGFWGRLGWK